MSSHKDCKPATRIVSGGRRKEWTWPVVNPPVWRGSTHLYENSQDLRGGHPNADGHFHYGRRGSPTQWALSEALTELEPGAYGTVLFPSGLGAISGALLSVLKAGDVLLMTDNVYEPSRDAARTLLADFGIETRFFDPLDLDGFPDQFCDRTKAVLLEAPGSLTLEVCDIPALAAIARDKGALSLIDNTWASPLGFNPLVHGCDITIMALTKHVGGHSDLMMGSVAAGEELYNRVRLKSQALGIVVSPDDAALALRGLRSMHVRLKQSTATALKLAEWLNTRPEVARVMCPMLPGAPGHDLWARDFTGGCGLFSFLLRDCDVQAQSRFIDALELFGIGYSWGGYESLATPFEPSRARSATAWPPEGISQSDRYGIRLAIGLEDADDLLADLAQAFEKMEPG
ncbi:cystathionine beta-lyase [Altericroceibacterium spongiae]|uniref:Cystathionine beta-lyase n=1 Tax=Altericroceibacterium spongiae TaxID=2320269 RepID=A0A420EKJ3_9SPHN|nr:cystathionine beta-lyase [Altericroceibacterium spongiae]RKF21242.1 cystathionine beta-lyase [Altericroceibacterium spongiae]